MLRLTCVALGALCGVAAACGDDTAPVRSQCRENGIRLSLEGEIGPTGLSVQEQQPFGGRLTDTVVTANVEAGATPHVLSFTSNAALEVDLWEAIRLRLESSADGTAVLPVSAQNAAEPCDPRQDTICAVFGVDTNSDGVLQGSNEVIYPVSSGEARFTQVTGNLLAGDFDVTFAPLVSGAEAGGETGGRLQGCFILFRTADRRTLF